LEIGDTLMAIANIILSIVNLKQITIKD
jgi:hypothetical protein